MLLATAILATTRQPVFAVVVFSQNFETATIGQSANPGNGFNGSLTTLPVTWEVASNNGAAGTKGLSVSIDGAAKSNYFVNFSSAQPSASDANPLGGSLLTSASQVRFSFDVKGIGQIDPAQLFVGLYQDDPNYEADRGIDVNGDNDMTDRARVFSSSFRPTISSDGNYSHVSLWLDQGTLQANIVAPSGPPNVIPLTPTFDPTLPLNWAIGASHHEFGLDSGNVLSFDNFLIEVVPEPSAASLLASLCICCSFLRRRGKMS